MEAIPEKIRIPSVHYRNIDSNLPGDTYFIAVVAAQCDFIDRILEEICAQIHLSCIGHPRGTPFGHLWRVGNPAADTGYRLFTSYGIAGPLRHDPAYHGEPFRGNILGCATGFKRRIHVAWSYQMADYQAGGA